ncbi:cyclin N-terminal domain-containing protein 1-like [Centruroides sculpturatus]|uniref:cyclin N-terminal domain-containing protein 1-like n=1 Tax=Centruroides sculpturatus TaxID=218467 RepID=UPI000C6EC325|nr:cyclin N-terminal domain-containing protein 1-like [Centruroides sculpturatus]
MTEKKFVGGHQFQFKYILNKVLILKHFYFQDFTINSKAVELVFNLCEKLQQPLEVKYLTLEIFDRFLIKHVEDLYAEVEERNKQKKQSLKWHEVESRIQNQLILRILSCMQLASKFNSHYQSLSPDKIKETLQEFGYIYSFQSLLNSELRILKTLDYRLNYLSPLVYMESLLEILAYNNPSINVENLYITGIYLIDFTYICRHVIYQRLYILATGETEIVTTPTKRDEFRTVKNDYLLLTTALIAASSYFNDPRMYEQIMNQLNLITWVPVEDIRDFSFILISTILGDNNIIR